MEYLVSFSIRSSIDTTKSIHETLFQRVANDGDQMVVKVSPAPVEYSTEINDEHFIADYGETISMLIAKDILAITLLHFNTFTVTWNRPVEELRDIIQNRLDIRDRFTIAKIDGPIMANFKQDGWLK